MNHPHFSRTWGTERRTDITFSLPDPTKATEAKDALLPILSGATIIPIEGVWHGKTEYGYVVSIVGPLPIPTYRRLLHTLNRHGCEAIQVERWDATSYQAGEYRPTTTQAPNLN